MKKQTQTDVNPYPFSDTNKRYQTYEYYLRHRYGGKCAKIPLDAGLSCPNVDAGAGCIYCSARGSGDSVPEGLSLRGQYDAGRESLGKKWNTDRCIAYLQAHTNTYAPVGRLREIYTEVLSFPGVAAMNIATRADCLPESVCLLLDEISAETDLTVELGLQSSSDRTAALIRRGHDFGTFREGYFRLRRLAPRASVCIHVILGLPCETEEEMMRTVRDVARLHPEQVKIHLLHVLKGTPLARMLDAGEYTPLTQSEYVSLAARALTLLPPDTVIARLTGDGLADDLIAPLWSRRKTAVINDVDKLMFENGWTQGCAYVPETEEPFPG